MTDNKNPLNIRPGDVLEYTGALWTGSFQGKREEVARVRVPPKRRRIPGGP